MIKIKRYKIFIVLIVLFLAAGMFGFWQLMEPARGAADGPVEFKIVSGMGVSEIAKELKSFGLIKSELIFKVYSFLKGESSKFQPGRHVLSLDFSLPKVVEALTRRPEEIGLVVPPGATLKEIDSQLSAAGIIEKEALEKLAPANFKEEFRFLENASSLEGFLLPDTYRFFKDSRPEEVAEKFLENFENKTTARFGGYNFLKKEDLQDIMIFASLLEKEIPDYKERRIAAGIFQNRLKQGMPLQVDATIVYAACGRRFIGCPDLTPLDYKIESPYNTYLNAGLPATPIGNPGLDAIEAVLNPISSGYLYYLSDPATKRTIFSRTLDEHNSNRVKYLMK